jgi:hypothetical protein
MATTYFRLEAPYPASASTVLLPSPSLGNNEGLLSQVTVIKMMDGSRRSVVKKADGKKQFRWDFTISRDKMEEVADFVKRYRGAKLRVVWRGRTIIGKFGINPVEFRAVGRAGGWPGDEAYQLTLQVIETE